MKTNKNIARLGLLAFALAACVAGCDSDSVTPHDELPPVTPEGAAVTAVVVSMAYMEVAPLILDPVKAVVPVDLPGGDVSGTVYIDFRDGPDGGDADPAVAAWARLYTESGAPVVVNVTEYGGEASFDLDVMGTIGRSPDMVTALPGSGGTMTSGDRVTEITIDGLVYDGGEYPAAGTVVVVPDDGPTADITFDGTNIAQALVGGILYDVNLDTGDVTEAVSPI